MQSLHKHVLLGAILIFTGCTYPNPYPAGMYEKAVRDGLQKIPQACEIECLFGESFHVLSAGSGIPGRWTTKAFVGQRYILIMEAHVEADCARGRIVKVNGEPSFLLSEVTGVNVASDGGLQYDGGMDYHFGASDWKKVLDAKGDFSVIGVKLNKTAVPGFGAVVAHERAGYPEAIHCECANRGTDRPAK